MTSTATDARDRPPHGRWTTFPAYFAISVIGAPLSILLHEAAHCVMAMTFGFAGIRFSYQAVTYTHESRVWDLVWAGKLEDAEAVLPLAHVGWMTMAGPLLNWSLCLALAAVARGTHSRVAAALGFLLAGRAFLIGYFVIFQPHHNRNDEDLVARLLGVEPWWVASLGMTISLLAMLWILRSMRAEERLTGTFAVAVGGVLGGYLYLAHVGPRLLP